MSMGASNGTSDARADHVTTADFSDFRSMAHRLGGEHADRARNAERALQFHNGFLDDTLKAILPNDLILIGAYPGIGKTAFTLAIATANAMIGKRVHYFALEAEPRELERRTKFARLSAYAHRDRRPTSHLSFSNWMLNRCEDVVGEYNAIVEDEMRDKLATLYTYYRGARFDYTDLQRQILDVSDDTDLIVVDHLHYVDPKESATESQAIGDTVHAIRDVALRVGRPVILVAHLRKPERTRGTPIMPDLFEFHGSGEIGKVATQAILFDRAWAVEPAKWYLAPTFMRASKDRRDGDSGLVALLQFDTRTKSYRSDYTLGKQSWTKGAACWEPLPQDKVPTWATRHRALEMQS